VRHELYDNTRSIGSARSDLKRREKYSLKNTSHTLGMMSETKVKKHKWYSLYDKVYAPANLERAWEKVRSNKGAGGVDRQSIPGFEREKEKHLRELHRLLKGEALQTALFAAGVYPERKWRTASAGDPHDQGQGGSASATEHPRTDLRTDVP
jgi:hypothetical protein